MAAVLSAELDLLGSHGMPAGDYPQLIDEIRSGALDPGRLIERQVGLADAAVLLADGDSARRPGATIVVARKRGSTADG